MDRTSALRQAAFRKRMKAQGCRAKMVWVDGDGFPVRAGDARSDTRLPKSELTREEFDQEINQAAAGMDAGFKARFFSQIAAYARSLRVLCDYDKQNPELWPPEEFQEKNL